MGRVVTGYLVDLSMFFEADSPEDAALQMAAWAVDWAGEARMRVTPFSNTGGPIGGSVKVDLPLGRGWRHDRGHPSGDPWVGERVRVSCEGFPVEGIIVAEGECGWYWLHEDDGNYYTVQPDDEVRIIVDYNKEKVDE